MYDPIKEFIKDFRSGDIPHELKKRAFAMSRSELRRFKDKAAAARKKQQERRAKKKRDIYFKKPLKESAKLV